ncbi:CoA-transferase subunit beta [Streptomyces catenulae]|uniref:CoA-transferase n=1 Tax=Streptomyces catenulae TaxID=66875 RepID=A0ABV2Z705_9ACTN|nr:CoA-transferase [Streptomyces catenulae]
MSDATRAEICAVACAEAFRGSGEILASAFGTAPTIGVRLARATFAPDLLLTDGEARLVQGIWPLGAAPDGPVEGHAPFRTIFDLVWSGRRHAMMMPTQIDAHGNVNLSAIGPYDAPKVQLLGVRGAPGNTLCHPVSYWIPRHSTRVFVPRVDMVCGVGTAAAATVGRAARHHDLRRVVTDLAVLDFAPPTGTLRLVSVHPGVSPEEVVARTGCPLVVDGDIPTTRPPTAAELRLIREVIDPAGLRGREVPA